MSAKDTSFYDRKTIMAPMVRAGRTPLRCLALDYGADLVYTEEIVDQKLLSSTRKVNDLLGTIDYCIEDDVVLRVAAGERSRCVLQIGTNSGENAAKVAKYVGMDVAAIDVNMGCPKPFSIVNGMGAALLTQTDKVKEIMTSLVEASAVPVSCKIRVLDTPSDTLSLVREIEKCGVSAIGVHGRRRAERPSNGNREEEIREVARVTGVPVIANGGSAEISCFEDIASFRERTGASSIMMARKALTTPSIFRSEGTLPLVNDIENFIDKAVEFDENYTMTKYVIQRMLGGDQEKDPRGRATVLAGSVLEICRAWNKEDVYTRIKHEHQRRKCKRKIEQCAETGIHFVDVSFPLKRLRDMSGSHSPKCVLSAYCEETKMKRPVYECRMREKDKRFEAVVDVNGKMFLSRIGQVNKKMAEQVAALAALIGMDLRHRLQGEWEELV